MPALPSDIAAALRPQIVVSNEDAAIKARFPNARDNSAEPAEGWFDQRAHAEASVAMRRALVGVARRRFAVAVDDLIEVAGVETHRVIDGEQVLDAPMMTARFEIDLEAEESKVEYFG